MLSDMQVETDALRWLVWKAASQLEQGLDATRASVFAWTTAAEQAMKIADNGVQVLGGHGFIRETRWRCGTGTRARSRFSRAWRASSETEREENDMIDFTLTANDQKCSTTCMPRGSSRASTRASTTRTRKSSCRTSCPRRRTGPTSGPFEGRTKEDTGLAVMGMLLCHWQTWGDYSVRMRRSESGLGNAALALRARRSRAKWGHLILVDGDHRAGLRLGPLARADYGGARREDERVGDQRREDLRDHRLQGAKASWCGPRSTARRAAPGSSRS